jgi:hypothetical protein
LSNNGVENPRNVNKTFQSLAKRLRTFKWVMLFVWAPLEIGGALALAMMALYRNPYMFVAFEILVVFAPLVAVNFLAVVVRVKPRIHLRGASQRFGPNAFGNTENSNNSIAVQQAPGGGGGARGAGGGGGGARDHSSDNESVANKHMSKKRSKETQLVSLVATDTDVVAGKSEIFKTEFLSVVRGAPPVSPRSPSSPPPAADV